MNKVLDFTSGISYKWWLVGGVLIVAPIIGYAASTGRLRTLALLLLPVGLLTISILSERLKFWLLAFSIPLSIVQIPSLPIPYGISLCEIILLALTIDELLFMRNDLGVNIKPLNLKIIIPLGLFTLAGLVAPLKYGGISVWHTYCLMPLLWFFLAYRKIHNQKEAWFFIKASLLTIISFVVIVVWANGTSHFLSLNLGSDLYKSRLGYGQLVELGPIQLTVWSTILGSIVALGVPACILLWSVQSKGERWWGTGALLMLAGFGSVLLYSAARGATVASILGIILVLFASSRIFSPKILGTVLILFVVITFLGVTILKLFPEENIQRMQTLLYGIGNIPNLTYRIDSLAFVWKLTLQNPLGVGFGYLWFTYGIDDSIIYAYILEATGILGSIAFLMVVVKLVSKFVMIILNTSVGHTRDFASLGLSTLAVGLVAGVSSQSILFEPVHAFIFWALMAVCYSAVQIP